MRARLEAIGIVAAVLVTAAPAALGLAAENPAAALTFLRDGTEVNRLDLATLTARCTVETVVVDDPYYHATKRFRACPLGQVLALGFGGAPPASADVLFRALDGYVRPASGARVAERGGFVAFADAEHDGWLPIARQGVDPGPFYVVWTGPGQNDPETHPWPFQLVAIEIADLARKYPHTVPRGAPAGGPAWSGYAIFREQCLSCHAINGEGGKVGPDLNVPRSIVEYRPTEQVKAYIKNPATFRYGNMPAHERLTDTQLDALIAYFEAMRARKHDPGPGR